MRYVIRLRNERGVLEHDAGSRSSFAQDYQRKLVTEPWLLARISKMIPKASCTSTRNACGSKSDFETPSARASNGH
jgi:hypothetical protein